MLYGRNTILQPQQQQQSHTHTHTNTHTHTHTHRYVNINPFQYVLVFHCVAQCVTLRCVFKFRYCTVSARAESHDNARANIRKNTFFSTTSQRVNYIVTYTKRQFLYTIASDDDNFQRRLNNERNHVAVEIFDFFWIFLLRICCNDTTQ